jgi:DNA-directed RNA polymerase subunit RPC12/RpoP
MGKFFSYWIWGCPSQMLRSSTMEKSSYREATSSDWRRTILLLLSYSASIIIVSFLLLPDNWYLWALIITLGTFLIISWHTKTFAYKCRNCSEIFEISVMTNFLGPNAGTKKYLKCPNCGKRSWAVIMAKRK